MAIYLPPEDAPVEIKTGKKLEATTVQAVEQKTYTQEEVQALLEQIQKGQEK